MRWMSKWKLLVLLVLMAGSVQARSSTPEAAVTAFLDAWDSGNIQAMYGELSVLSQQQYPLEVFSNRYTAANEAMVFEGVSYRVNDTVIQGQTAAVSYDAVIDSTLFGRINDPGRTMRLMNDADGWGVVWSSMDIFDVMTSETVLSSGGALPARASIYDGSGSPIASPGTVVGMWGSRQNMTNEEGCKDLMAGITRKSRALYEQTFAENNLETIFFIGQLNLEDFAGNSETLTSLCGITYTEERAARVYYGNNAMSHVVGLIGFITQEDQQRYLQRGYEIDDLVGRFGVEAAYEQQLAGAPERVLRIREPGGYVLRELGGASGSGAFPVQLTIDRNLQVVVTQALHDAYAYAGDNWARPGIAGGAAAAVIDVSSGAVLALASYPLVDPMLFDPDNYDPSSQTQLGNLYNNSRRPLANHAIEDQYTPGSVFKIVTAAALLNEGIVPTDSTYDCPSYWNGIPFGDTQSQRADWTVTDELPATGVVNPSQAIMSSCNPFFWEYSTYLFDQVGTSAIRDYALRMGLGQSYGLNIGYREVAGNLDDGRNKPRMINISTGQGDVQVPPLQMAVMTAAVANGGTVYRPYVVQQVGGFDGTEVVERVEPEVLSTLDFAPGVLQTLQAGMCGVVEDDTFGTAYRVFENARYTVCGKTGTAEQNPNPPNAWFISYAPADNPQIATVVMVATSREGSEVAAPITRRILDVYFGAQIEPFPEWWADPYIPLNIPEGGGAG